MPVAAHSVGERIVPTRHAQARLFGIVGGYSSHMTANLLRGKKAKGETPDPKPAAKPIAIGEVDAHVFNCPSCARPLADGTWRCEGCGALLILGVTAKRASAILGLGLVVGVLVGGVFTAAAITLSLHDTPVQAAVVIATPAPIATAIPNAVTAPVGVPQAAVTALSGTAVVNGRISADTTTLAATLADPHATTIDLARGLRSLSADAALGTDLVARLAQWRDADTAAGPLGDFYRKMSTTATLALRDSLNDASGYRSSASEMLGVLKGLSAVDAASRVLAATVDLELPPVVMPATH